MRFVRLVTTTQLPSQIGFVTKPESLEFGWVSGRESRRIQKKAYTGEAFRGCHMWIFDELPMKRRVLLARGRDVDAEKKNKRYGSRANGHLKRRLKDYKEMC
jgi:hypothetical protein